MEIVTGLVALGALVVKFTDLLKFLTNKDWNAAITQIVVWVAGFAAVGLFAQTVLADGVEFGGVTLADMNLATLAYIGLTIGSAGSVAYDFKRARDDADTAKTPPLIN